MRRTAPDQAECARLGTLRITSATEGAVIPRLYGCLRNGGNIIWPTDFREKTRTTRQGGGKGGTTFFVAMKIDRASGQVKLPHPTILPGLSAAPSAPPSGKVTLGAAVYLAFL